MRAVVIPARRHRSKNRHINIDYDTCPNPYYTPKHREYDWIFLIIIACTFIWVIKHPHT
jgi:hypothetical protein